MRSTFTWKSIAKMAKSFLFLAAISVNSNKSDAARKWIVGFFSDQVFWFSFFFSFFFDAPYMIPVQWNLWEPIPLSKVGYKNFYYIWTQQFSTNKPSYLKISTFSFFLIPRKKSFLSQVPIINVEYFFLDKRYTYI